LIGGKILSGRTEDQNIGYIAEYLTAIDIDLKEVRVAGDEERATWTQSMRSGIAAPIVSSAPAGSGRPTVTSPPRASPRRSECPSAHTRNSRSSLYTKRAIPLVGCGGFSTRY
jgi:hypothetical protein